MILCFWKKYLGRKKCSKILLYLAIVISFIYLSFNLLRKPLFSSELEVLGGGRLTALFSSRVGHLQRQCLALVGAHVARWSFPRAGGSFSIFGWERRLLCAEIAPNVEGSDSGIAKIPQVRIGSFPFTTRQMHERLEIQGISPGASLLPSPKHSPFHLDQTLTLSSP